MFTGDYSKITFPQISMGITGSGGESINNLANALNESAAFLSKPDNNGMGQGGIFDYGKEPVDTTKLDPSRITTDNIRDNGSKYEPEVERYHKITREIENQERALDKLSEAKDNAYGASKISLMDKEIAEMEVLKSKQQELLDEANKYLVQDEINLKKYFPEANIVDGNIVNYEELMAKTTSEEQAEALKQYEETADKVKEAEDALIDLDNQIKYCIIRRGTA